MNYRKLVRFFPHAVILLLLVGAIVGYAKGFRLDRTGIARPGALVATIPLANSEVYLDEQKEGVTATSSETMRFDSLPAGKHTLLVGREGYWPWQKTFRIESKATAEARPFQVPKDASGIIISNKDPEYWKLVNTIRSEPVPSPEERRISADRSVAAWVEGGNIYASFLLGKNRIPSYFCPEDACTETLTVYKARETVRSLDFYPGRPDVLIFAFLNGVYAVEIDATGMQNFQPIFKGALPSFVMSERGTLLIEDSGHLYELSI